MGREWSEIVFLSAIPNEENQRRDLLTPENVSSHIQYVTYIYISYDVYCIRTAGYSTYMI